MGARRTEFVIDSDIAVPPHPQKKVLLRGASAKAQSSCHDIESEHPAKAALSMGLDDGLCLHVATRPRKAPLTDVQRRAADDHTMSVLRRHGIDFRPRDETALLVLETGEMVPLDQTLKRWSFAREGRARAAVKALSFDAFIGEQKQDFVDTFRFYTFRPRLRKAFIGGLANEFRQFSQEYGRVVERLMRWKLVRPIVSVIQIRFDVALYLWDLHAHCIWSVLEKDLDPTFIYICKKFSDPKIERSLESPAAVANYSFCGAVDYANVPKWPEEAILELWYLQRPHLIRPAGQFSAFRRGIKGKTTTRRDGIVYIEERPSVFPRRKSRRVAPEPPEGHRVVAIVDARVSGARQKVAVLKRARRVFDPISQPSLAFENLKTNKRSRPRLNLAYGEYALKSPHLNIPARTKRIGRAQPAIPYRKRWMLRAWPRAGPGLSAQVLRRLARPFADPKQTSETSAKIGQNPVTETNKQLSLFDPASLAKLPWEDQVSYVAAMNEPDLTERMPMPVKVLHHAEKALAKPPYSREYLIYGVGRAVADVMQAAACSANAACVGVTIIFAKRTGQSTYESELMLASCYPSEKPESSRSF